MAGAADASAYISDSSAILAVEGSAAGKLAIIIVYIRVGAQGGGLGRMVLTTEMTVKWA